MKIITGRSHPLFAQALAQRLGEQLLPCTVQTFSNGELRVRIQEPLAGQQVALVQTISTPANDQLMELLLLANAAKQAGASNIIVVVPYFGYSRQDKACQPGDAVAAELVAHLMQAASINELVTLDLHTPHIQNFFTTCTVHNLETASLFVPLLTQWQHNDQVVVIAPDRGSAQRAQHIADALGLELVSLTKTRNAQNQCHITALDGSVAGKHCIMIDDIIDTGETVCHATAFLKQYGAASVEVCATHAVLASEAAQQLAQAGIQRIVITDSMPIATTALPPLFHSVSSVDLIAQALQAL